VTYSNDPPQTLNDLALMATVEQLLDLGIAEWWVVLGLAEERCIACGVECETVGRLEDAV